jgi:hypothetical protein
MATERTSLYPYIPVPTTPLVAAVVASRRMPRPGRMRHEIAPAYRGGQGNKPLLPGAAGSIVDLYA